MALVHDLAESLVGDITPHDGVSKEEKYRRENVRLFYVPYSLMHSTYWCLFSFQEGMLKIKSMLSDEVNV